MTTVSTPPRRDHSALAAQFEHAQSLVMCGDHTGAIPVLHRALALEPCADGYFLLGLALRADGDFAGSVHAYRSALAIDPTHCGAATNLGATLLELGLAKQAVEAFEVCLKQASPPPQYIVNFMYALHHLSDVAPTTILAWHRRYAEPLEAAVPTMPAVPRDAARARLRIGMVSGDLREHPVGLLLMDVLAPLRARNFELYAYATQPPPEDDVQRCLRKQFDGWRDIAGLRNSESAALIRDDAIDILIDLAGYTGNGRPEIFAFRPAPLQVSWLGYWATTGLTRMDAVLTDAVSSPVGDDAHFVEPLVRMPIARLPFSPPRAAPSVTPLPALKNGYVTFGSFNNACKITPSVISAWVEILKATPNSRLFLKSDSFAHAMARNALTLAFAQNGIAAERLRFEGRAPRSDYYQALAQVDIALDSFPFNGGTTTLDGLWMGVPIVTLMGDRMIARQGAMLLQPLDLADWVASSESEYIAMAVQAAQDIPALAALRTTLRTRLAAADYANPERYADVLATTLRTLWCAPPVSADSGLSSH